MLFPKDHWSRDYELLDSLVVDFNRYKHEENNGRSPQQGTVQANWSKWSDPQRFPTICCFTQQFVADEFIRSRSKIAIRGVSYVAEFLEDFADKTGQPCEDIREGFWQHTLRFQSIVTVRNCETWRKKAKEKVNYQADHWFQYTDLRNVRKDLARSLCDFVSVKAAMADVIGKYDDSADEAHASYNSEILEFQAAATEKDSVSIWASFSDAAQELFSSNDLAKHAVLRWIELAKEADGVLIEIVSEELGVTPDKLQSWLNQLAEFHELQP